MSETKETDGKTIRGSRKTMTLNLKRTVESGHVRQNFSHGRSKSVLVERKKNRSIAAPGASDAAPSADVQGKADKTVKKKTSAAKQTSARSAENTGTTARELSTEEKDARSRALAQARVREVEERKVTEVEAERQAREAEIASKEADAQAAEALKERESGQNGVAAGESARPAQTQPGETKGARAPESATAKGADKPKQSVRAPERGKAIDARAKKPKADRNVSRRGGNRVKGRLTIANALNEGQRERSLASLKRKRERLKSKSQGDDREQTKIVRDVVIPEAITIQELANRMAERSVDVIRFLMNQGQMHKFTDIIDADSAQLITEEFGHMVKRVSEADVEEGFIGEEDSAEELQPRAPIVTVMGHVDHGKTSLLDSLRNTNVVEGEAGGITQHIGAYQVDVSDTQKVTFIDTPGHAAFTSMRARGAKVTDIVILVVSADDGVMPQTVEAINHAKAAKVPIIVAINKMDKPDADPNKVRTDLLQHEVVVEGMSGDVLDVEVSALKGTNLDKLLEAVLLQAEILELKANPNRSAEGVVIEAKLDRGRGPVGTALIQRGTLKVGDIVVAGSAWGRVRALLDDHSQQIDEAGPSIPVEVLGFNSAPEAGDQLAVVDNEARAREITDYRIRKRRETQAAGFGGGLTLEQMMTKLTEEGTRELPLLLKADVQGSVEAITAAFQKLGTDEVQARVVHAGVGGITESDIALAVASSAPVIGFNVRANVQARDAAQRDGVEIRYYAVIYDVIDDIKAAMSGLLSPELRETFLGNAEIMEIFNITKVGKVAGCRVTEGKVERGANVRLIRDDVVIHEGKLSTLKRFKDEVKEVVGGQECGMAFENYQDMRAGDVIECFQVEEIKRSL
ncbi:translation initiation factor IF-2 [bacterium MnTg02]|nr:translation initiation factor IF-2 [bacterium MnTg02]